MENYKVAVLLQPDKTKSGTPMFCVPQKIINMLECYNIDVELIYLTPIFDYSYKEYFDAAGPIIPNNSYEKMKNKVLSCDGLLLTGGNEFYLPEIKLIQDAYKNKLPILGICLGMQTILTAFGGKCIPLNEKLKPLHKDGAIHKINIKRNSQLSYLGNVLEVNSYHSFHVVFDEKNPQNYFNGQQVLYVTAYSDEKVIEMAETYDGYITAVQFHPESAGLIKTVSDNGMFQIENISDITNTLMNNFVMKLKNNSLTKNDSGASSNFRR